MTFKLKVKPGDQRPFTRRNKRRCSISTAAKRTFGGRASTGAGTTILRVQGRSYTLRHDGGDVVADHDAGNRIGRRTVTLTGKVPPTLEEQAAGRREAAEAGKRRREARKAKRAARKAAAVPVPRPAARGQARPGPGPSARGDRGDGERAGSRARTQEAEGREWLRRAQVARTARPPVRHDTRPAPPRVPQPVTSGRQPRAIEPPRPAPRWLRNPFTARPEPREQRVLTGQER